MHMGYVWAHYHESIIIADFNRVRKFTPEGDVLAVIDSKLESKLKVELYMIHYGLCVDSSDVLSVTE